MTEGATPEPEPTALVAELWFEQAPDLTDPGLLEALRALSPDAEAQQDSLTVPYRTPGRQRSGRRRTGSRWSPR